jgi:hypothetical protein
MVEESEMPFSKQMKILNDTHENKIIKPLNEAFEKKYESQIKAPDLVYRLQKFGTG